MKKSKESPYPTSDVTNYVPYQRAENKKQGLEIEWMNIPNKPPLEDWIKFDEYVNACKKWVEEMKLLERK